MEHRALNALLLTLSSIVAQTRIGALRVSFFACLLLGLVISPAPLRGQDCIDYGEEFSPHVIGSIDTPDDARGVSVVGPVVGTYGCVADGLSGIQVVNISNPTSPVIVGSVDTPG